MLIAAALAAGLGHAGAVMYQSEYAVLDIREPFETAHWSDGTVMSTSTTVDGFVTIGGNDYRVKNVKAQVLGDSIVFSTESITAYMTKHRGGWDISAHTYDPGQNKLVSSSTKTAADKPVVKTTEETPEEIKTVQGGEAKLDGKNLKVLIDNPVRTRLYQTFTVEVTIYDTDINSQPELFPHNGGLVNDIPVKVSLTGKIDGKKLVEKGGVTKKGVYDFEYYWKFSDVRQEYAVLVDVDDGGFTKTVKTYYYGFIDDLVSDVTPPMFMPPPMNRTIVQGESIKIEGNMMSGYIINSSRIEANGTKTPVDIWEVEHSNGTVTRVNAIDFVDPNPIILNSLGIDDEGDDGIGMFKLGNHTIMWNAMDFKENTSYATQMIIVEDTTPPELTIPMDSTREAKNQTNTLTILNITNAIEGEMPDLVSAVDIVDGEVMHIGSMNKTVSENGKMTLMHNFTTGNYKLNNANPSITIPILWNATDASGNSAFGIQNVTLNDTAPPMFVENGTVIYVEDMMVMNSTGTKDNPVLLMDIVRMTPVMLEEIMIMMGTVMLNNTVIFNATDLVDPNPTITPTYEPEIPEDASSISNTTITWKATDFNGNSNFAMQTITITNSSTSSESDTEDP